ncbi:uncharacterized protein MEPE_03979 [Melanopsichium pennsylvanicum]|uniref:Uncharacterized protein n=1 Tax=Melanopsichium pennsylvanicum TaxID=63383 RepID=A0AAJ4XN22_9BASI|nr:uncharacterized protein MEPE_03979 [Melanopsichium pennsylvanicum]
MRMERARWGSVEDENLDVDGEPGNGGYDRNGGWAHNLAVAMIEVNAVNSHSSAAAASTATANATAAAAAMT